jgi:galactokinase/mevalonate kinase-like predicted kinase
MDAIQRSDSMEIAVTRVDAPLRLDPFGNWSDHPDFLKIGTSRVVTLPVCFSPETYPARASVLSRRDSDVLPHMNGSAICKPFTLEQLGSTPVLNPLALWVRSRAGDGSGSARGLSIDTHSDAPLQSGLGTSSALTVCMTLIADILSGTCSGLELLAERAYRFESSVSNCGWQDHFATATGRPLVISRASLDALPDLIDLPVQVAEMIYRHGFMTFLSRARHPPIHWEVRGNEDTLFRMDEIVDSVLAARQDFRLAEFQDLVRRSWRLARRFTVQDFAGALDARIAELSGFDACGFLVGAGPAAVIVCAKPEDARARLERDGLSCRAIHRPSKGVHAVQMPPSDR